MYPSFNPRIVDPGVEYDPGTVAFDDLGNAYIYIHASSTIRAHHAARVLDETYHCVEITIANGSYGNRVAIPQVTIHAGQSGWGLIYGHGDVAVNANVAAHAELHTSTTAGRLDDNTGSSADPISGITLTSTTTSAGVYPAQLNWPIVTS